MATDYEKKYKDALERAREFQKSKDGLCVLTAESIFPELAESEDERIRKELVEAFEALDIDSSWNRIPVKSILAWLEKQKEQKPAEWSEEDEEILKLLILNIGRYMYFGGMSSERILSFLKSLRPQYHGDVTMTEAYKMGKEAGEASSWKPSEEQMKALNETINILAESPFLHQNDYLFNILNGLREELKKLL